MKSFDAKFWFFFYKNSVQSTGTMNLASDGAIWAGASASGVLFLVLISLLFLLRIFRRFFDEKKKKLTINATFFHDLERNAILENPKINSTKLIPNPFLATGKPDTCYVF
ncbi:unnamed protein product [Clavelina lepadiformis]|uniref:ATP synthase F0 subunit 8 n=1 Tax=Clavelina lepadiformis TaxID=159417 RepID=A0ABP0GCU9_CLALP